MLRLAVFPYEFRKPGSRYVGFAFLMFRRFVPDSPSLRSCCVGGLLEAVPEVSRNKNFPSKGQPN